MTRLTAHGSRLTAHGSLKHMIWVAACAISLLSCSSSLLAQGQGSIAFQTNPKRPSNSGNGFVLSAGLFAIPVAIPGGNITYEFDQIDISFRPVDSTNWTVFFTKASTNMNVTPKTWTHTNDPAHPAGPVIVRARLKWFEKRQFPVPVSTPKEVEAISGPVTITNP